MKIILVRHGESKHNSGEEMGDDTSLTKKGEEQIKHLSKRLKGERIEEIYSSNLIRSKQTAEIISKILNVPIRRSFGEMNEYDGKLLRSRIKSWFNPRIRSLRRVLNEISKDKKSDKTILISAHGVTNRIILGHFLAIPIIKQLLNLQQDNSCINIIYWNDKYGDWSLNSMNDVSHLPIKLIGGEK